MDKRSPARGSLSGIGDLGFLFVTLDLEGFSSGKLNRALRPEKKQTCEA